MSRIGKAPINIPENVKVEIDSSKVTVNGKLGTLSYEVPDGIDVSECNDDSSEEGSGASYIEVKPSARNAFSISMWGTVTTTIRNMVHGVSKGYSKSLIVVGTGYRSFVENGFLRLSLGYSHDIIFAIAPGIDIKSEAGTIVVSGYDKQKVGQICGEIISYRPVEPYKGKGIYISGSRVRRKEGKKK